MLLIKMKNSFKNYLIYPKALVYFYGVVLNLRAKRSRVYENTVNIP